MLLMLAYTPAPWILWVSDPPWETHFHGYHGSCRWAGKSGVNPGDLALFFFNSIFLCGATPTSQLGFTFITCSHELHTRINHGGSLYHFLGWTSTHCWNQKPNKQTLNWWPPKIWENPKIADPKNIGIIGAPQCFGFQFWINTMTCSRWHRCHPIGEQNQLTS